MKVFKKINQLYNEVQTFWVASKQPQNSIAFSLDEILEFLKIFSATGTYAWTVNDFTRRKLYLTGGNTLHFWGKNPEEISGSSFTTLVHHIKLSHIPFGLYCAIQYWKYIYSKPAHKRKYIKASFCFTTIRKGGQQIQTLLQSTPIVLNEDGNVLVTFGIMHDVSHIVPLGTLNYQIIDDSEAETKVIPVSFFNKPIENLLSPAEQRIMKEVYAGLNSVQIAEKLSLSVHTVRQHRKNILEKTKTTNTVDLIKIAIKENLL